VITAWRLATTKDRTKAFDGIGTPGRWTSADVPVVYLADSMALAALEALAHLGRGDSMRGWFVYRVEIEARLVTTRRAASLPRRWNAPKAPASLTRIGDAWVRRSPTPVLALPSALIEAQQVFLVNSRHPDFPRLRIGRPKPFAFDPRLEPKRRSR
jgi:RES domain-containing protein